MSNLDSWWALVPPIRHTVRAPYAVFRAYLVANRHPVHIGKEAERHSSLCMLVGSDL
jgi:uncharacterized protein YcfJ